MSILQVAFVSRTLLYLTLLIKYVVQSLFLIIYSGKLVFCKLSVQNT